MKLRSRQFFRVTCENVFTFLSFVVFCVFAILFLFFVVVTFFDFCAFFNLFAFFSFTILVASFALSVFALLVALREVAFNKLETRALVNR